MSLSDGARDNLIIAGLYVGYWVVVCTVMKLGEDGNMLRNAAIGVFEGLRCSFSVFLFVAVVWGLLFLLSKLMGWGP